MAEKRKDAVKNSKKKNGRTSPPEFPLGFLVKGL
jgi:hypothetical protein